MSSFVLYPVIASAWPDPVGGEVEHVVDVTAKLQPGNIFADGLEIVRMGLLEGGEDVTSHVVVAVPAFLCR